MRMELSATHCFSATPDRVYAMLCDPRFRAEAARALGARQVEPTQNGVRATLPTPPEVRPFLGPAFTLEQRLDWEPAGSSDGARRGHLTFQVVGMPAAFDGTAEILPTETGSEVRYVGDFKVNVPLMGRKLEQVAAPTIRDSLDRQQATGLWWLANHG